MYSHLMMLALILDGFFSIVKLKTHICILVVMETLLLTFHKWKKINCKMLATKIL
uniref:Uncharacterized protein n=1 Tax=Meloidogyne enterolobii TaxID=390850 RepID=A0A6V7XFN1_MELEN|nr:unnamed protein product [Meloidogyne enterolobii]